MCPNDRHVKSKKTSRIAENQKKTTLDYSSNGVMQDEIASAVVFLTRIIRRNEHITKEQINTFTENLKQMLMDRYKNHWYVECPWKGSAYRCIRVNDTVYQDKLLEDVAKECQLTFLELMIPTEMTLWIDPHEVTVRIGEHSESYYIIATRKDNKFDDRSYSINIEDLLKKYEIRKSCDSNVFQQHVQNRSSSRSPWDSEICSYEMYSPSKSNKNGVYNSNMLNGINRSFLHSRSQSPTGYNSSNSKFNVNAAPFLSKQQVGSFTVSPASFVPADSNKYHWVRGADLIKA